MSVTPMPAWLNQHLADITVPKNPDRDTIIKLGNNALAAKIADVEEFNLNMSTRMAKRIPSQLSKGEITMLLLHIFTFREISLSDHSDDTVLGMYVPSNDPWWCEQLHMPSPKGIYVTDERFFYHLVTLIDLETVTKDVTEIMAKLQSFAPKVNRTTDIHLYPVNNGVFNQKTKTLEPYSPEYVYITKIHVDYDPNAKNPRIQEPNGNYWDVETWLKELSATDEINTLLWQVIAAGLQPNRGMNKSIWFYSESGNNGKGTVGQLIKNLLGSRNYASLSVSDFKHEFLKQSLLGVAANISDENDVDEFIDSVKDYKASVTGDDILVNRKHKDPVRLQFRGLNIQMMNGLPKTRDKSGSFYRRLIIVPFIKSFTNNGEKSYIKSDYINRKDVLQYVLLKALHLEFDTFIVPDASDALLNQYKERNNPVLDFWNQLKGEFVWDLLPKQFLYDLFLNWFDRSNPSGKPIAQRTFFDQLSPIVDADPAWDNRLGSDCPNVRSDKRMDDDEPLITEYGLDRPYKNGAPSPWASPNYNGSNAQKKRDFARKTKYRGIVRN